MSRSSSAGTALLRPRKPPSQSRSAHTIQAILQAAADVLERDGLEGYNTNVIAERAGTSIGSLYQYFPGKDAITVALIEREGTALVGALEIALADTDRKTALRKLVDVAALHQMRRPRLARLLDLEEDRLAHMLPQPACASAMRSMVCAFLSNRFGFAQTEARAAAEDLIALTRALTDAAGRRSEANAAVLRQRIWAALIGYLEAVTPACPR